MEDGKDVPAAGKASGYRGRVILTLCKLCNLGGSTGYPHSLIPIPSSYQDAQLQASRAFTAYLPRQTGTTSIVLKCAVQRKDGSAVWCNIGQLNWPDVVRDGDEIGVFLPENPHAPYKAEVVPSGGLQSAIVAQGARGTARRASTIQSVSKPATPVKTINLFRDHEYSDESRMIGSPTTLKELKDLARGFFGFGDTMRLEALVGAGVDKRQVELHESGYARFIETTREPITIVAKLPPNDHFYDWD